MELTSYEIEQKRFGTAGEGYDRAEVDRFRTDVARAMAALERELDATGSDLEGLVRLESRRGELEAAIARLSAKSAELRATMESEQLEAERNAREEARRITAAALEQATDAQTDVDNAFTQLADEGAHILEVAIAEAAATLDHAEERGRRIGDETREELRLLRRRLAQLRTALSDIEGRLRAATGLYADEVATVRDLIDLETRNLEDLEGFADLDASEPPSLQPLTAAGTATSYKARSYTFSEPSTVIDLADPEDGLEAGPAEDDDGEMSPPQRDESKPGFYQRRLAGLRERIEKESS